MVGGEVICDGSGRSSVADGRGAGGSDGKGVDGGSAFLVVLRWLMVEVFVVLLFFFVIRWYLWFWWYWCRW